ncbi:hypothetical protein D3C87_1867830 [compost metagenome]
MGVCMEFKRTASVVNRVGPYNISTEIGHEQEAAIRTEEGGMHVRLVLTFRVCSMTGMLLRIEQLANGSVCI